jgi:uncharacterized protein (DUF2336 family)
MQLTAMDIKQLIKNPSSVALDTLAERVVIAFAAGDFNLNESSIASDIFRLLLKDAEKSMRATLAEHLYDSPNAPHDVIFKLACDEADISARILQYSPVLTDDDLVVIVSKTAELLNLCAIAQRDNLSEKVTDALLDTRQEAVLSSLFNNKGARLGKNGLERAWGVISSNNSLLEVLARRGGLPFSIVEKIFLAVSDELKNHIANEYKFSSPIVQRSAIDTREWELLGIMPVGNIPHPDDDRRIEELVEHLYKSERLTYSLIIRALCMGYLNLFEMSLAKMADIPRPNARILIMGGSEGFHALYNAAGMPEGFADAVEKLLNIAHKISDYGYSKPHDFRKLLVENIYVKGYHRSVDGMGYLLSIIDGKISGNYASSSVH